MRVKACQRCIASDHQPFRQTMKHFLDGARQHLFRPGNYSINQLFVY
jgi:hypothetical protein